MGGISYPTGRFLIELDGASVGYAKKVEGGTAVAEVIQEQVGSDHFTRKHIGSVKYGDIVVTCDAGLSKAFYDWVAQASASKFTRKDGAVVFTDGHKELSRLEWRSGLITGITFPKLDISSKDWLSIDVKITPELTRRGSGGGSPSAVVAKKSSSAGTFRLTIDGFEEACKSVSKIEPIAIVGKVTTDRIGHMREGDLVPTALDAGNLVITLPESKAKGFYDWFDDFVIKGNSGQSKERRGMLESGPFSLAFGNLGIISINRPSKGGGAAIRDIQVEMYCETAQFGAK